jgi:hypothetical protein
MTTADMRLAAMNTQLLGWKTEDLEQMIEAHELVVAFLEEMEGYELALTPLRKKLEELKIIWWRRKEEITKK